jgi:hypothetical protein
MKTKDQSPREAKKRKEHPKRRRSKGSNYIPIDTAALAVFLASVVSNRPLLEQGIKLVLGGSDNVLRQILEKNGIDTSSLPSEDHSDVSLRQRFREFSSPLLKTAAEFISIAPVLDGYLKSHSADDAMIFFYMITRLVLTKDDIPSKMESKRIWQITLDLARSSKIVAREWNKKEAKGDVYLKQWIRRVKDTAHRRFRTFLKQKARAENNATSIYKSLLFLLHGDVHEEPNTDRRF